MYTAGQVYELALLLICIWREARGESTEAQLAVGWVIRNRVLRAGWFGKTFAEVILKPSQFSSFGWKDKDGGWHYDAQATQLPTPTDPSYEACLRVAKQVYDATSPDPPRGATYYFDDSLAANPPSWAKNFMATVKIGRLNFFRDV